MRVSSNHISRPLSSSGRLISSNVQQKLPTTSSTLNNLRFHQKRGVRNRRDFLMDEDGKLKPKIYFSDDYILAKCSRAGELPDTYIPVMEPEVKITPERQVLGHLYKKFKERYNRHRNLVWYNLIMPMVGGGAWVAPSATVVGHVMLKDKVSVWYNAVMRGDKGFIEVDPYTNIQDGAVITTDDLEDESGFEPNMSIGAYTTIGHNARLHSCKIGEGCLIGIGATVLEGAVVENGAMVAAGAVVPPGRVIPAGEIWAGNPAKFMRKMTPYEVKTISEDSLRYTELAATHDSEFTLYSPGYREVEEMAEKVAKHLPKEKDPLEEEEFKAHEKYQRQVDGSEHFF